MIRQTFNEVALEIFQLFYERLHVKGYPTQLRRHHTPYDMVNLRANCSRPNLSQKGSQKPYPNYPIIIHFSAKTYAFILFFKILFHFKLFHKLT